MKNSERRDSCFLLSFSSMGKLLIFFLSLLATTFPPSVSLSSLGEEIASNENYIFNLSKLEMFVDELPDMPTLLGYGVDRNGSFVAGNLIIGMYQKFWKFHRDLPATSVFAYGDSEAVATVPGPTIESIRGIPTYVTWTNHLPSKHILPWDPTIPTARPASGAGVPTVVHLHGGVHPPTSDGNSYAWFTAGFAALGPTFAGATAFYPNQQRPGNLWYHDHAMGLTRANLLAGLVGSYTLRSPDLEDRLGLPSGRDFDRRLVLFDRSFRADGSLFMNATGNNPSIHPQWQPEYFGTAVVVNGKAWPFLIVRRRRYRFRILNASNARFYGLYFINDDRLSFRHVGSDSNYLARPVTTRRFLLAPSEIADVVIDFAESSADAVVLGNDAQYPYPSGDPTDALNGQVMKFLIRGVRGESDPSRVPALLAPELPAPNVGQATKRRYIAMYEYVSAEDEPTHLYLNALPYEAPATETPAEGSSEVWEVINLTEDNHPLHVHLAVFVVLEQRELHGKDTEELRQCMQKKNDAVACGAEEMAAKGRLRPVPAHEQGWKNVFKMMPGAVTRVLVRFAPLEGAAYSFDPTAEPGYVYHCHILDHEDNEMMRPLKLVH